MKSYPTWEQVRAALGDKVVAAVITAVGSARADLKRYRQTFPLWVAESTERGLAAWIHDRLWAHLVAELDGMPNLAFVDKEPLREVFVGLSYRIRIKRHHEDGHVETYPTPMAMEFLGQVQATFDGLEEWHLIAGYVWQRDVRGMDIAVISLRDGERIIWERRLDEPDAGTKDGTTLPATPQPTPPTIQPPVVDIRRTDKDE